MNTESIFKEVRNAFTDKYYDTDGALLVNGNSLELLMNIPDHCIALILTDPPYQFS
jgi:site-specific DNA-methyltransferase (adenine-specific)